MVIMIREPLAEGKREELVLCAICSQIFEIFNVMMCLRHKIVTFWVVWLVLTLNRSGAVKAVVASWVSNVAGYAGIVGGCMAPGISENGELLSTIYSTTFYDHL